MSVSSVSLNTDVNVRYDRLKGEYLKLRNQAKILQEGVKSERETTEKLRSELRVNERDVRKLRNENESLVFRNEQLTRRVESLQVEVENDQRKSVKKSKAAPSGDVISQLTTMTSRVVVLEEELADKLRQNEALSTKIVELESLHSEELAELSRKFRLELAAIREEAAATKDSSITVQPVPNRPVEPVKPIFVSSSKEEVQIPSCDDLVSSPAPPESFADASQQVAHSLRTTLLGLETLFLLLSQRTEIYPFDMTMEQLPLSISKLSPALSQSCQLTTSLIKIVDTCMERGEVEWSSDSVLFGSALSLLGQHCCSILPPLLTNMAHEESKVTWSNGHMESLNSKWCSLLCSLLASVQSISMISTDCDDPAPFQDALGSATLIIKDLSECFRARWLLEARFPTTSRRLICVGDALRDCLDRLAAEMEKLTARVGALSHFKSAEPVNVVSSDVVQNGYSTEENDVSEANHVDGESELEDETQTGREIKSVSKKVLESGSCSRCATQRDSEETSAGIQERLKNEICALKTRISDLESERERHLVDVSLLRRKVSNLGGSNVDNAGSDDSEHVREFARSRLRNVLTERQKEQSAAHYYQHECATLLRKMRVARESHSRLETELREKEAENDHLTDELSSVRRGYETQLSSLSEHVANLNMKIMEQTEEKGKREKTSGTTAARGLKSLFNK